ncbi:MAG: glutathione peroxidase, partial [Muribaculaceae bacterium]|nr:glutathione peroxidase [Muribaculaceae bacterium]
MKHLLLSVLLVLNISNQLIMAQDNVYGFTVLDRKGKEVNLGEAYSGKVLLIVNTATRCGFTPQYEELEALYKQY